MNRINRLIVVTAFVFLIQSISAQTNYTTHILKQGESLSTLAKQYNTSVGDIMRLNGMHADTKLVYGSKIKIPSSKTLTTAVERTSTKNTSIAKPSNEITHIVTKGETLYSISKKYNISVDQIKTWNHLTNNDAKIGSLLIISDKGNDKFATSQEQKQTVETKADEEKNSAVTNNIIDNQTASTQTTTLTEKPEASLQTQPQVTTKTETQPSNETASDINVVNEKPAGNYSGEGYFATQFSGKKNKRTKNISGISKTFKTASGWTDGKYYILANDIEPGTIVKITAENGSEVYAKVLWNMGDLKENSGADFRVSSATAAALHESESSFNVNVSF